MRPNLQPPHPDDAALLEGVRVLELYSGIAGGYCGKMLVDAGAEVVKVEPPGGDPLRRLVSSDPGVRPAEGEAGALFSYLHAGKTSTVAATDTSRALEQVVGLAAGVDVVIEEPSPGESLANALRSDHGELIVMSITPFGLEGPWAARPASDLTIQALASSIAGRGERTGHPVAAGGELTDWAAGSVAAVSALAALASRRQTGTGDHVDVSKLECAVTIFNGFRAVSGQMAAPPPPPYRVVEVPSIEPAKDGWVGFCTLSSAQFASFAEMIGAPEWSEDPDISRIDVRIARSGEIRDRIAEWTERHTVAEILAEAGRRRIPASPVGDGASVPELAHFRERRVFVSRPGAGHRQPRIPYRLSRSPQPEFGHSPPLGAANPATAIARPGGRTVPLKPPSAEVGATGPLRGVRVFDLTSFWAGPYCSQILGLFGAEVVKVESVKRPDGTRLGTSYGIRGERAWERAPLYQSLNTGKLGITLDLADPRGRELGRRLLGRCDVLVENFAPRVAEQFGLLEDPRPDLVVVRMPAWGLSGPWRDLPGFAQTMEQASGLAWVTGFADQQPLIPRGPCDPIGGLHAAFAALAAIRERYRSGLGQVVEAPLVESALNVAGAQFVEYGAYRKLIDRRGNKSPFAAPHGVYACGSKEEWVAIAVLDDNQWVRFGGAIGNPAWTLEERYETSAGRLAAEPELDLELEQWCGARSAHEIEGKLSSAGVPAARLVAPHEVVGLDQLRQHRGFFERVDHPVSGTLELPVFPARFASRHGAYHSSPAPTLGQHNREVLQELLGVDDDTFAELEKDAVIGTEPA